MNKLEQLDELEQDSVKTIRKEIIKIKEVVYFEDEFEEEEIEEIRRNLLEIKREIRILYKFEVLSFEERKKLSRERRKLENYFESKIK